MSRFFEVEEKVDLKPCPFCGREAYITGMFVPTGDGEINAYLVGCKNCEISFQQSWDYEIIVERWNRRVCKCRKEN